MDSQQPKDQLSPQAQRRLAWHRQLESDHNFKEFFTDPIKGAAAAALNAMFKCRAGGEELVRLHQEWVTLHTITNDLDEDFASLKRQEEEVSRLPQTEQP